VEYFGRVASVTVFPGTFAVVGILTMASLIFIFWRRPNDWLLWTVLGSVVFAASYSVATGKFLYDRVFGFFFPLALIVVALAWGELRRLAETKLASSYWNWILPALLAGTALASWPQFLATRQKPRYSYAALAHALSEEMAYRPERYARQLILLPWVWDVGPYLFVNPVANFHPEKETEPSPAWRVTWLGQLPSSLQKDAYLHDLHGIKKRPNYPVKAPWVFRTAYWNRTEQEMTYWTAPFTWPDGFVARSGPFVAWSGEFQLTSWTPASAGATGTENALLLWQSPQILDVYAAMRSIAAQWPKDRPCWPVIFYPQPERTLAVVFPVLDRTAEDERAVVQSLQNLAPSRVWLLRPVATNRPAPK
jgi:hypothetical protein